MIGFKSPTALRVKLQALSESAGVSLSETIRALIERGLANSTSNVFDPEALAIALAPILEAQQSRGNGADSGAVANAVSSTLANRFERLEDAFAMLTASVKHINSCNAYIPPDLLKTPPSEAASAAEHMRLLILQNPAMPAAEASEIAKRHWASKAVAR